MALRFAAILMNRFGSLETLVASDLCRFESLRRAFNHFDYNHKGRVTRGQFQTTLATIRLDTEALGPRPGTQEVVGLHMKKLFRGQWKGGMVGAAPVVAGGAWPEMAMDDAHWYKGFDHRPILVKRHEAARVLHGYFCTDRGTIRNLSRVLDLRFDGEPVAHPAALDLPFEACVASIRRAKDLFSSLN
eukprot:Skav221703  [mRNA]  locus=scaffold1494:496111:498230:+ [translate_table: standard]